jgi:hypothetical protein
MNYALLCFLIWVLLTPYNKRLQLVSDLGRAWRGETTTHGEKS